MSTTTARPLESPRRKYGVRAALAAMPTDRSFTMADIAAASGVSKPTLATAFRYARQSGLIAKTGEFRPASGKGKRAAEWRVTAVCAHCGGSVMPV